MMREDMVERRLGDVIIALAGGLLSATLGIGSAYLVWSRLAQPDHLQPLVTAGAPIALTVMILALIPWRKEPMMLMGFAYIGFLAFALAFGSGIFH